MLCGNWSKKILADVVQERWLVEVSQKASHDDVNRTFPNGHHKKLVRIRTKNTVADIFRKVAPTYISRESSPEILAKAWWFLSRQCAILFYQRRPVIVFVRSRQFYCLMSLKRYTIQGFSCELNHGCVSANIGPLSFFWPESISRPL